MRKMLLVILLTCLTFSAGAQKADYAKMSSMVRQIVSRQSAAPQRVKGQSGNGQEPTLCAFVLVDGDGEQVLQAYDCKPLARFGNIYIASIPLSRLGDLSLDHKVSRIEANRSCSVQLDSMALEINAKSAYEGLKLPQAFTGKDVVVGVQDIGFDLTHPTFYDTTAENYRIKALWDQLSTDESSLYVGADYTTEEALKAYQHSRDGNEQGHGTHTTGIAAGSGYGTSYRGVAYESDICLVCNATTENSSLIDSANIYKYTYATDALGFKYIFDYAQQMGKPCVASFSEGSYQDFRGDDQLYYQVLDSLVGPGRILVASAGNRGLLKTHFRKEKGTDHMGTGLVPNMHTITFSLKSGEPFTLNIASDTQGNNAFIIATSSLVTFEDSLITDTVENLGVVSVKAFPSCYDPSETAYDVEVSNVNSYPIIMKVVGEDAAVDFYLGTGWLNDENDDPKLKAGEYTYGILSPGSAPSVICVGATSYRKEFYNKQGVYRLYDQGVNGIRAGYSSAGPTFDERMKPDVMAPGTNVLSAYNSFVLENTPTNWIIENNLKETTTFGGREYPWAYDSGTSMSTPAVAGAIALWLQADPTLTPEQVMDVIASTSYQYDSTLSYPNNYYGYGQIDVYKGLLKILNLDGIEAISDHQPVDVRVGVTAEGMLRVASDSPFSKDVMVSVYSVNGVKVMGKSLIRGQSEYLIDLSALPHGLYAVQVNGGCKRLTGSTLIRR